MKISFDLDDLIIPGMKRFEIQPQSLLHKFFRLEKIRKGTPELLKKLKASGHVVGIYTTSYRSVSEIRKTFLLYGVKVDFVINQQKHMRQSFSASKYPPAFDIDLHIDDSEGVRIESEKFGFRTMIVSEDQEKWAETIIAEIEKITLSQSE